jgi:hypothetical protein
VPTPYGQALVNATWDEKHKPAIRFYIDICQRVGLREKTLNNSFLSLPESTRKNRLNGWLLIQQFCASEGIDAKAFETEANPVTLFADIIGDMEEKRVSDHLRETARPAMQALLDVLGKDVKLTSNS